LVAGVILTYCFSNSGLPSIQFALSFSISLSVAITALFGFGSATIGALVRDIKFLFRL
jgi:ABC-type polysaccharide/polyol phosphate export permease